MKEGETEEDELPPVHPPPSSAQGQQRGQGRRVPGAYPIAGFNGGGGGGRGDGYLEEQSTIVIGDGDRGAGGEGTVPSSSDNSSSSSNIDNEGLVEARRVVADDEPNRMEEARPVYYKPEDALKAGQGMDVLANRLWCGFAFVVVVVFLSLVVGFSIKNDDQLPKNTGVTDSPGGLPLTTKNNTTITGDASPTRSPLPPPPPMENLDQLYQELSPKTKTSLADPKSHQYQAWEWLLHHPGLTTFEEWRKKQIFALSTFYLAYGGPTWPTDKQGKWMNYSVVDECSWILSEGEVQYFTHASANSDYGPYAYGYDDYLPCNPQGQVQTILLHQLLNMPATTPDGGVNKPYIPPEIELLSSLGTFANIYSQLPPSVYLQDLMIPEFINLPNLVHVTFQQSGVKGPIPKTLGQMTNLRHLGIGANKLTGTVPTELSNLSNTLQYLSIGEMDITGTLPTQLGLMTSLTYLCFGMNFMEGTIPSQLGLLTNNNKLYLQKNSFQGTIPPQLGQMANTTTLYLHQNHLSGMIPSQIGLLTGFSGILDASNNDLTGSIPSELGLMSNMTSLRLGNDPQAERGSTNGNNFTGFLPPQTWQLLHLEELFLPNLPNLRGTIPSNLFKRDDTSNGSAATVRMPNLRLLNLHGSTQLSGVFPESVCNSSSVGGLEVLDFTCTQTLCGCDCECPDN